MSQADIQSYIQQLAGTHSLGQSNLPSNVNNGNPNTIYNYKPPQGGYLPPVSNAYDQWRINPMQQSGTPIDWMQLAMQGSGNGFGFDLGGIAPAGGVVGGGTGGGGVPLPPPGTGGGGGGVPTPGNNTGDPPVLGNPPPGGGLPGDHQAGGGGGGSAYGGGGFGGAGGGYTWDNYAGSPNGVPQYITDLYGGAKGSFLGLLDAVSEPFFPGNFYHSGTGNVNWAAIASAVGGHLGLPISKLIQMGETALRKGLISPSSAVGQQIMKVLRENAENKARNSEKNFDSKMLMNEIALLQQGQPTADATPFSPQSSIGVRSAYGGFIGAAPGMTPEQAAQARQAAQDMFAAMKLASLKGERQAGRDPAGHRVAD